MEKLTIQEEEAMQVIWQCGPGFIKDFLDNFPEPVPPYTTLASTLKNLLRKGFIKGEKFAKSYRYTAVIAEEEYKKRFMYGFVSDYFENSYKDMVAFFVKDKKVSTKELKEIIDLIEKTKK